jgi:hypothetical protein
MTNMRAVLLGSNDYQDKSFPPLACAENDVKEMASILSDPIRGLYEVTKMAPATDRDELLEALETVVSQMTYAGTLLIYYSGHAFRDSRDRLYLALAKTDRQRSHTAVSLAEIATLLDESKPATVILILDCCFSGTIQASFRELQGGKDIWIVTSSTSDQSSFEKEGSENSILTGFLLDGLRWGLADSDHSGKISVFEAYEYARNCVKAALAASNVSQDPVIFLPVGSRKPANLGLHPEARRPNYSDIPLQLLPTYIASMGLAGLLREDKNCSGFMELLHDPCYFIEGEWYRAMALPISGEATPNIIAHEDCLECDAFFRQDLLAPSNLTNKQVVDGVVRVRMKVPFTSISSILVSRSDHPERSVELIAAPAKDTSEAD